MNRKAACVAALLVLSACGNQSGTGANNAAADAGEVSMRAGKYEIDFVREAMVPGQPSEPTHETDTQCFSADDLRHPEGLFVPASEGCTEQEAKASKGQFSARLMCSLPEYSPSDFVFEVNGTYDSESADLTGEANVAGATLRETRTFRRRGDC